METEWTNIEWLNGKYEVVGAKALEGMTPSMHRHFIQDSEMKTIYFTTFKNNKTVLFPRNVDRVINFKRVDVMIACHVTTYQEALIVT